MPDYHGDATSPASWPVRRHAHETPATRKKFRRVCCSPKVEPNSATPLLVTAGATLHGRTGVPYPAEHTPLSFTSPLCQRSGTEQRTAPVMLSSGRRGTRGDFDLPVRFKHHQRAQLCGVAHQGRTVAGVPRDTVDRMGSAAAASQNTLPANMTPARYGPSGQGPPWLQRALRDREIEHARGDRPVLGHLSPGATSPEPSVQPTTPNRARTCERGQQHCGIRGCGEHSSIAGAQVRCPWPLYGPQPPHVPWPHPVDLDFQREAQHDPDQHDQSQDPYALQRLVHQDGPNDVSNDQHLQTQQDHTSEVRPQLPERISCVRGSLPDIDGEGNEPADDHNGTADALNDSDHLAGDALIAHDPTLANAANRQHPKRTRPLSDGLTARLQWPLQEHLGRLQDLHDVAPEAHVARMLPLARLVREQG